jgi:hypothetical protein
MAGGGVVTNLTPIQTSSIDTHLLVSALQRSGISFASAHQFSQGQLVSNSADRLALAGIVSTLLKSFFEYGGL